MEDIESKLDLLIELIKEDKKHCLSTLEGSNSPNSKTMPQYPRLRSILTDKNGSEPSIPPLKNPSRPIFRNHSDLGPRLRKKVTYRNNQGAYLSESEPSTPVSILKKGSVSSVPSEPDINEGEDLDRTIQSEDLTSNEYQPPTDSVFANIESNHVTQSQSNERGHVPVTRSTSDITERHSRETVDIELGEKDSDDSTCNTTVDDGKELSDAVNLRGLVSLEMISEKEPSASHHSSVHSSAESVVLAPHNELFISETGSSRSERYPSYNSTESEYMSDREDSPVIEALSETTPLNSAYQSCPDPSPHRQSVRNECVSHHTIANNQSNKINHLKPESQGLLMRPEVLKLRKTSC